MSLQKNAGAVRRFARLARFGTWLQNLPNRLVPAPFRLMQIGSAFWQSRALYVAARLDIATVLGDRQLDTSAIANAVSSQPDATFRLLRLLAAMGIFEEVTAGVFRNNRLSNPLREDDPQSIRAMILMHNSPTMSRPWYEQLEAGVRHGEVPFEREHGQDLFAYMDAHAEFDALFSRAMDSVEALLGDSFATDFDWGRFRRVIDVGGSRGSKAVAILKHHPHLEALIFDRRQVIDEAAGYWAGREEPALTSRLHFEAGDLLQGVPRAAGDSDIYLLSAVLHGFDDETARRVLRHLATAIGDTGARVAVMEFVLPEAGTDLTGASFDMQMFVNTRGRERTRRDWRALAEKAGLALDEEVNLRSLAGILVLSRP